MEDKSLKKTGKNHCATDRKICANFTTTELTVCIKF